MVWKCPPLHLPNWNHLWKWKQEMNASELAEYVTNVIECTEDWESDYFKQVVTTLHKQQTTITELEIGLKNVWKVVENRETEIEALNKVNAMQVDYITQQKYAYGKLWKEHMELFWKHEKDQDEEQEK